MILWAVPALAAAAYCFLVLIAALRWKAHVPDASASFPPLSVLKPMYGSDERLYAALRSHATQDYPEFEILFGVSNPRDPALADIQRLRLEFPAVNIRIIRVMTDAPNPKAYVLSQLAREAAYPMLLVNDDDIHAGPGYFRTVIAALNTPNTGLVTCLYRARAESWATHLEALGIATEFAPSVLVARLVGVVEFALGATMALRAETLREIGGFEPIAEYLADDYQLGLRVARCGHRIELTPPVVETSLGAASWRHVWQHQLRWARTVRVSRPGGYYGSLITHATLWSLVAFASGIWWAGVIALILRLVSGYVSGAVVMRDPVVKRWFWLMPLRDLLGFAVWLGGCAGTVVYWRDRKLRLERDGRISEIGKG